MLTVRMFQKLLPIFWFHTESITVGLSLGNRIISEGSVIAGMVVEMVQCLQQGMLAVRGPTEED